MLDHLRVVAGVGGGSGGGTRTRDPTIMSRVLLPTELLRRAGAGHRPAPTSPLTDLNRRPLPYHGSALPTELRGRSPTSLAEQARLPLRTAAGCVASGTVPGAADVPDPPGRAARRRRAARDLQRRGARVDRDLRPASRAPSPSSSPGSTSTRAAIPAIVAVDDDDDGGRLRVADARTGPGPRTRPTVEDSVYVRRDLRGQGVGRLLLGDLVELGTRPRLPLRDRPHRRRPRRVDRPPPGRAASNRSAASARSAASSTAGSTS